MGEQQPELVEASEAEEEPKEQQSEIVEAAEAQEQPEEQQAEASQAEEQPEEQQVEASQAEIQPEQEKEPSELVTELGPLVSAFNKPSVEQAQEEAAPEVEASEAQEEI